MNNQESNKGRTEEGERKNTYLEYWVIDLMKIRSVS